MDLAQPDHLNFYIKNWDIVLPRSGRVLLSLRSKGSYHGAIWLHYPDYRHIMNISDSQDTHPGRAIDLGAYPAFTRLVFALVTLGISSMDQHGREKIASHENCGLVKLQHKSDKWQVRLGGKSDSGALESSGIIIDIEVMHGLLAPAPVAAKLIYDAPEANCPDIKRHGSLASSSMVSKAVASKTMISNAIASEAVSSSAITSKAAEPSAAVPKVVASRDKDSREELSDQQLGHMSFSGSTADSYEAILSWDCQGYTKKTIRLGCRHEKNNLKYRIRGYNELGSANYTELWPETELGHGDIQPFVVERICDRIVIDVKSAISGEPSTFVLEYGGKNS